jgi:cytochrome c biogenesis protein CcmG/thiol:disulfide interchange protein DsbE
MRPQHRWLLLSALLLLAGAAWTWASRDPEGDRAGRSISAPRAGFPAPDFTLPTAGGESLHLADLRGRPVLVNLWASWCLPCRSEMPAMQRVYADYQESGFLILAVNATNQDSREAALAFARENGLTFPILLDEEGQVSQRYGLQALPTSFFIDPAGVVREVVVGGPMSEALLRIRVQQLLE